MPFLKDDALSPTTDPLVLRRTFACHPSGVTTVCAMLDGAPVGMAVATFVPVSLDPPLVSICIDRQSSTWPKLCLAPRLGLSTLADIHERACRQLSAKHGDRFAGVALLESATGAVVLADAAAWFECSISEEVTAGDHLIVLLRVEALAAAAEAQPLIFHASGLHRGVRERNESG